MLAQDSAALGHPNVLNDKCHRLSGLFRILLFSLGAPLKRRASDRAIKAETNERTIRDSNSTRYGVTGIGRAPVGDIAEDYAALGGSRGLARIELDLADTIRTKPQEALSGDIERAVLELDVAGLYPIAVPHGRVGEPAVFELHRTARNSSETAPVEFAILKYLLAVHEIAE